MKHPIVIHWLGIRKDSGRGALWGYFSLNKDPELCLPKHISCFYINKVIPDADDYVRTHCYVFTGKIGKKMNIEKRVYDERLLEEISARKKNYREANLETTPEKWGKALDEEMSIFLTYATLLG